MSTNNPQHTVVLDAMGADGGPEEIVRGGIAAARQVGDTLHVMVVGNRDRIEAVLAGVPAVPGNLSVQHAESEIPMRMSATDGVRMRDSSVSTGLRLVKDRQAVAFISPGNTGAVMATALLTLGRIEGVSRPAITALFPTSTERPTVVLDVGANADSKPHHLSQYAVMGSVYSQIIFGLEAPRVGLLSIGEERSKGNELIFSARELLKGSMINFVGNIEGRDILSGAVDVAVTDGFTGNILLKFAESIQPLLVKATNRQIQTNIFSRFGFMLMLPFMRRMKGTFDYSEYGGAPLLGVNGIVVVCHGSSNAKAICRAIVVAVEMASKRITERIHSELATNHFGKNDSVKEKSQNYRNGLVRPTGSND
ncbi:MAG: phosphate acyltransferase PlsX [Candidatus Zixiibacteriota bacterium]|nr:MAG: phosphate acyltransferase PlsX [candidate division Zixibacteria bacterium]